jgi:hypothetical protein
LQRTTGDSSNCNSQYLGRLGFIKFHQKLHNVDGTYRNKNARSTPSPPLGRPLNRYICWISSKAFVDLNPFGVAYRLEYIHCCLGLGRKWLWSELLPVAFFVPPPRAVQHCLMRGAMVQFHTARVLCSTRRQQHHKTKQSSIAAGPFYMHNYLTAHTQHSLRNIINTTGNGEIISRSLRLLHSFR